ncbi:hypothetical protein OU790_20020, partial [Ruegeria sp. NA]
GMIEGLKALGCFTEIIAFQLRVFLPHGDGIDTGTILAGSWGRGLPTRQTKPPEKLKRPPGRASRIGVWPV